MSADLTHEDLDQLQGLAGAFEPYLIPRAVAMARRTADAELAFRNLLQLISEQDRRARDAGLTFETVRQALSDYESNEISFSKLVELLRVAARVMAEAER